MRFPILELNITEYISKIKQLLEDSECHIFIDTNILSQLFKLNEAARQEFYNWVDCCGDRFHIPNWTVMEYSKCVYGNRLVDYLSELSEAQRLVKKLEMLQKFFCGYIDENELVGTTYQDNKDGLLDDMKDINEKYVKLSKAVVNKKSEHIKKVQKEIEDRFKNKVADSDIYKIIGDLYFDYQLRLDEKVPPGFEDKDKKTNTMGDLIIWNEILRYCKDNNVKKVIFITRDGKPDYYYMPECRCIAGHSTNEELKVAHESLVYEFKLCTGGSENCYLINFYTLVKILSDINRELAFSFQLVSRDRLNTGVEISADEEMVSEEEISLPVVTESSGATPVEQSQEQNNEGTYSKAALSDADFVKHCSNSDLKLCIERLSSHNWYIQNDAIDDLHLLLNKRSWEETKNNKDAFFVIGRNILQSADGNAFEACRFIGDMSTVMSEKSDFLVRAIIDGCLYEVFFNSKNEIRKNGFKARYFGDVVEECKKLTLAEPFGFINRALRQINDVFVPVVGDDKDYAFEFAFRDPENVLDEYHTVSLKIDGFDVSESFSNKIESRFAKKDDLKLSLSWRYAIPVEHINISEIPDGIDVIHLIKKESNELLEL